MKKILFAFCLLYSFSAFSSNSVVTFNNGKIDYSAEVKVNGSADLAFQEITSKMPNSTNKHPEIKYATEDNSISLTSLRTWQRTKAFLEFKINMEDISSFQFIQDSNIFTVYSKSNAMLDFFHTLSQVSSPYVRASEKRVSVFAEKNNPNTTLFSCQIHRDGNIGCVFKIHKN